MEAMHGEMGVCAAPLINMLEMMEIAVNGEHGPRVAPGKRAFQHGVYQNPGVTFGPRHEAADGR